MKPAAIYSDGEYLAHNATWHEEDSGYKASLVLKAIERNAVPHDTCCDVGCGAGLVTEILAERYVRSKFVGYDISTDAQKFWRHRKSLPNLSFSNEDLLSLDTVFDLVICLDVFEHVEDYFAFLRALRKKGRNFIFNIPLDMNVLKLITGHQFARDEVGHLHYFSKYTALETLKDCGYSVADARLSATFLGGPPKNIRQWLVLPIRLFSLSLGLNTAAKFFGGISLVVYATAP